MTQPAGVDRVDVHQHLIPPALAEALRSRRCAPRLDGSVLHRSDAPPTTLDPAHFDVQGRATQVGTDGCERALVSLSAPIGIEGLPPDEAHSLLSVYHDSAVMLPPAFGAWASACVSDVQPEELRKQLSSGFVGLQLPATALLTPRHVERMGPLLTMLEAHDKPLLVHPGTAEPPSDAPAWWPAVVEFVQQMHAAWHAWLVAGQANHPRLRVCFVALAGLAPAHRERLHARGGHGLPTLDNVYYETSSYQPQTVAWLAGLVGGEAIVYGSDRPYAQPGTTALAPDTVHATRTTNPRRLLTGNDATPERSSRTTRADDSRAAASQPAE
ncbi:MAG: amidohydrolase family protein [Nocardioidaceae bacterium]